MTTSSLLPIAATISVTSSSAQGELSALMRVHRPVAPKSVAFAMAMKPRARGLLGVGRDGVLEIAEHDIDLPGELRHLGAHLLDMRRHEMDHALEPDRQLAQRRGRADRERLIELARQLHALILVRHKIAPVCRLEESKRRAKLPRLAISRRATDAAAADDRRSQSRAAVFRPDLPRLCLRQVQAASPTRAWPG